MLESRRNVSRETYWTVIIHHRKRESYQSGEALLVPPPLPPTPAPTPPAPTPPAPPPPVAEGAWCAALEHHQGTLAFKV